MKKDQIVVAAILAFLATLMVTSAQAEPLVFSNGKQLSKEEVSILMDNGKIVGNWYKEKDGSIVIASDSKDPVVRIAAKVKETRRVQQENKDQARADREAIPVEVIQAYIDREFYITGAPRKYLLSGNRLVGPDAFREWLSEDNSTRVHLTGGQLGNILGISQSAADTLIEKYQADLAIAKGDNGRTNNKEYARLVNEMLAP